MAVTIDEAMEIIYSSKFNRVRQTIPIELAISRVISSDIVAKLSLPLFNNSAMDGYAIIENHNNYEQIDTIFAGDNRDLSIENNQTMKIMTGAKVPANATAILPIEDVSIDDKTITPTKAIKPQQHIRFMGEDIAKNSTIIELGTLLNAHHIALLASQGITHIEVFQKPRIAIFASGDELKMHYEDLESAQLYNTNAPTLYARALELGCDVVITKSPHDSKESIKNSIKDSLGADIIITTGGVSIGDADFTKAAFSELGFNALFEGVDIKPGKPTSMARLDDTIVLNLPGNPLAMALCFELFGVSLIMMQSGRADRYINPVKTTMASESRFKKGKYSMILGHFDGESFSANTTASPGMVLPQSIANSFIIIDKDVDVLCGGDSVNIISLRYNFGSKIEKNLITKGNK